MSKTTQRLEESNKYTCLTYFLYHYYEFRYFFYTTGGVYMKAEETMEGLKFLNVSVYISEFIGVYPEKQCCTKTKNKSYKPVIRFQCLKTDLSA